MLRGAIALTAWAAPSAAQPASADDRRDTAPVTSAEPADTRAARLAFAREDSLASARDDGRRVRLLAWMAEQRVDTVAIGGVRWHLAPSLRAVAESALRRLDADLQSRGVPPMAALLHTPKAWLFADAPPSGAWLIGPRRGRPTLIFGDASGRPATSIDIVSVDPFDGDLLTKALDRRLHAPLWDRVDGPLKRWTMTAPTLLPHSVFDPEDARAVLISTRDVRGPRCASGVFDACEAGLLDTAATAEFAGPLRAGLISTALRLGGAGAWRRLLADSAAPMPRRIEGAAQRPMRAIVAEWHREQLMRAPERPGMSAALALGLAAVLSALGLRRPA
jgi:hypothetical protein